MAQFTKGMLVPEGGGGIVSFQWNPKTLVYHRDAAMNYLRIAGSDLPQLQYTCGKPSRFTFDIEFSRHNNADTYVQDMADKLMRLALTTESGSVIKRPPIVQFVFGDLTMVKKRCFVDRVSVHFYGLFNPDTLNPYEAVIKVDMWEISE